MKWTADTKYANIHYLELQNIFSTNVPGYMYAEAHTLNASKFSGNSSYTVALIAQSLRMTKKPG